MPESGTVTEVEAASITALAGNITPGSSTALPGEAGTPGSASLVRTTGGRTALFTALAESPGTLPLAGWFPSEA